MSPTDQHLIDFGDITRGPIHHSRSYRIHTNYRLSERRLSGYYSRSTFLKFILEQTLSQIKRFVKMFFAPKIETHFHVSLLF